MKTKIISIIVSLLIIITQYTLYGQIAYQSNFTDSYSKDGPDIHEKFVLASSREGISIGTSLRIALLAFPILHMVSEENGWTTYQGTVKNGGIKLEFIFDQFNTCIAIQATYYRWYINKNLGSIQDFVEFTKRLYGPTALPVPNGNIWIFEHIDRSVSLLSDGDVVIELVMQSSRF